MKKKYQSIQQLFEVYDKASDEATDYHLKSLEARKNGKAAIANYLDKNVYPKLAKRSYELLCQFSQELESPE